MKTIVVTGGCGFIGSNFIFYLRKKNPDLRIICLDSLTYAGNSETIKDIRPDETFRLARVDIRNKNAVSHLFAEEKPNIVVNFAAESHVDRSIVDPHVFLDTNILGTSVLMDACLQYGVERFHQVSTDEVYGDLPLDRPDLLFNEKTPLHASSPYSASKAGADLLVQAYIRTYGLKATISRCSNNYGPFQFPEKLIPKMISLAMRNQKLTIYGDGLNVRDWLYVEDHCRAIDLILEKGTLGEVYNVGGHNEKNNNEIAKTILEHLGKDCNQITHVADRKGHDRRYAIDPTKISDELGWCPKTNYETGIKETVDWNIQHQEWMSDISTGLYLKYNEAVPWD